MREILVDNEHWYKYVFTPKTYFALAVAIIPAGTLWAIRYFFPDPDTLARPAQPAPVGGRETKKDE